MAGRSILQDSEREFLEAYACHPNVRQEYDEGEKPEVGEKIRDPDCDERKAKYRIENEVVEPLKRIIRTFRQDLIALWNYYMNVKDGGSRELIRYWSSFAATELKQLRDLMESWAKQVDETESAEVRDDLDQAARTLAQDLDQLQWRWDRPSGAHGFSLSGEIEAAAERGIFLSRKNALMEVLEKEGLFEIFKWIKEHEGEHNIPDRTRKGTKETWKQCIGRYLESRHGLVEKRESRWGYWLTDRGQIVWECWEELKQSQAVDEENRDQRTNRQTAANYVGVYFDWDQRGGLL